MIGLQGNVGQTVYSASKAGLVGNYIQNRKYQIISFLYSLGFTKSLAKELGPRNVTANVIAPGFIDVGMTSSKPTSCV